MPHAPKPQAADHACSREDSVPRATREDIINQLRTQNERTGEKTLEDAAGRKPVGQDAGRRTTEPAGQRNAGATQTGRPAQDQPAQQPGQQGLTATPQQAAASRDSSTKDSGAEIPLNETREGIGGKQADSERDIEQDFQDLKAEANKWLSRDAEYEGRDFGAEYAAVRDLDGQEFIDAVTPIVDEFKAARARFFAPNRAAIEQMQENERSTRANLPQQTDAEAAFDGSPERAIQAMTPVQREAMAKELGIKRGKKTETAFIEALADGPRDQVRSAYLAVMQETPEPAESARAQSRQAARATDQRIEDFGEKIGGARKDVWTSYKDALGAVADDDIASQPLSKAWPQPDYQALLDSGADSWAVAFARAARGEIPSKPRQSGKVKRWAEQVRILRDTTMKLMDGRLSVEQAKQLMTQFTSKGMSDLAGRVELYTLVGHGKSLDGVRIRSGEYSMHNRVEYNPPRVIWTVEKEANATAFSNWPRELATGATREEALKAFKEKYDSLDINPPAKKEVTFDIYSKRGQGGYFIGKKVGRNYIDLAGPFANVKAAREHKATKQAELVAKLEKAKEIPRERSDTNKPRVGEDMRNGQDVTPQMFGETFGFRGVEFGNWVENGRRQKDLNDAFDAFMDMAAIIGVPPKALSLNGELGLAFGARGGGGVNPAAAHYEPGKVVINITKKSGEGSLGHEWWHALDNYFSRMRSKGDGMMTGALDVSLASLGSPFQHQGAVRKEMVEAFGAVMKAIRQTAIKARSEKLDAKRSKDYWTTDPEMSARAFESYLISKLQDQGASNDYLANIVAPETWKAAETLGFELDDSYPYPTAGEIPAIRAGFDHLFQTIETRETDKGVAIYSQTGRSVGLPLSLRASELTIEDELEKRLEGLAHRPEVLVLDSAVGTLPGASDKDGISGANWDGRIYLFRDQLSNRFDVQRTLFHELLHYGLRRFLTRDQFIAQMNRLYNRDAYIKREADDWVKTPKGQQTVAEAGLEFAKARGADEALATLAEPNQGEYLKTDLLNRTRVAVTRWLAQLADALGFKQYAAKMRSYKNEEARQLIRDIFAKLREDAAPARNAWNDSADPAFAANGEQEAVDKRAKAGRGDAAAGETDAGETDADVAMVSRSATISVQQVEDVYGQVTDGLKNAPLGKVVQSTADLPFNAPADVKGVFWKGDIYLVSDNIAGAQDARDVIAHEMIGHYGLRGFFGAALDAVLNRIHASNPRVQMLASQWKQDNVDLIAEWKSKYGMTDAQVKARSIEEALSGMAEKGEKLNGWNRLAATLQTLLRKMGATKWANALEAKTDAEALLALKQSEMFVRRGLTQASKIPDAAYPLFARAAGNNNSLGLTGGSTKTAQPNPPPTETLPRKMQRLWQDKLNRFTVIKEWLAEQGISLSESADVYKAEERMHSRFANKAQDLMVSRKDYTAENGAPRHDNSPDTRRAISLLERAFKQRGRDVNPFQGFRSEDIDSLSPIAQAFGTRVIGFGLRDGLTASERKEFGFFNGARYAGNLYVNVKTDRPHLAVLGHEVAHEMRERRPDLMEIQQRL